MFYIKSFSFCLYQVLLFCVLFAIACNAPSTEKKAIAYHKISGKTMGTSYNITYESVLPPSKISTALDSLLLEIDNSVSTYNHTALISKLNQNKDLKFPLLPSTLLNHFEINFKKSKEIYTKTNGYFDPTVMPLVNYWGFGYKAKKKVTKVDSIAIKNALKSVGLDKINWEEKAGKNILKKDVENLELDFSSIAKGYGVDALGKLLESKGIQNYLVEIGGETLGKGVNSSNQSWVIGVNIPKSEANTTDFLQKVQLQNKAVATSGNYRNFYVVDGKKYAHTINPKTGFPEINNLLSVSVLAGDCMSADAFATAFMAMGLKKAQAIAQELPEIEALFIYNNADNEMSIVKTTGFTSL